MTSLPFRLALGLTFGLAVLASSEVSAAEVDPWMPLDDALADLVGSDLQSESSLEFGVYIKTSYRRSNELVYTIDPITFAPLGDFGAVGLDSIGLSFKGSIDQVDFKFGYNPVAKKLRSTYARWRVSDSMRWTMGKFKVPLLRSRLVRTTRLLFIDRTVQARATGPRELGLKGEFEFGDRAKLYLAVQDGKSGTLDKHRSTARVDVKLLGGGISKYEGAYKAHERLRASLGLGYSDDSFYTDGRVLAADLGVSYSRLALAVEAVDNGDDLGNYKRGLLDPATFLQRGGTRAYAVTLSCMLVDKKLEMAARLQDFGDTNNTQMLSLGLNHYIEGHHAKLQLNWIDVTSDIGGLESNVIAVGFVLDA